MKSKLFFSFFITIVILIFIQFFMTAPIYAQNETQSGDVSRCGGVGPLDPDYCGCTWGEVYYRGMPISYLPVSLHFANRYTETTTQINSIAGSTIAAYETSGISLGAKQGDIMTVSTEFLGKTITRSFRAIPDVVNREQHVPIVIPEHGTWRSNSIGDFTQSILISGTTAWFGGSKGLISLDLSTNISQAHDLPWSELAVVSIAKSENGKLWAAGPHSLAYYDGFSWNNIEVPFSATMRSLVVYPSTEELWIGGGDITGIVAIYGSGWQTTTLSNRFISAMTVDGNGDIWAGTWGDGVFRHDHSTLQIDQGWTQFKLKNGVASDYIHAAVSDGNNLWLSTRPYLTSSGTAGGISRYHFDSGEWQTFDLTNGLPSEPTLPSAPASFYSLAIGTDGTVWGGADQGMHLLATQSTWVTDIVTSDVVRSIAIGNDRLLAVQSNGELLQLDPLVVPGNPPTVTLPTDLYTVSTSIPLSLTAYAQDGDEDGGSIIGWEWVSDLDGYLCTTAEYCDLSTVTLSLGEHQITVRVQDDEGTWSMPITAQVLVTDTVSTDADGAVFLPLILSE